eukprot:706682-Pleurochrysis_carterae.AAC.1
MPPVHQFERDFQSVYDAVGDQDFIDANLNAFPMEWIGARRFMAALINYYKAADPKDKETKTLTLYELFKSFTRERGYVDGSDYNGIFEAAHALKLHVGGGRFESPGDWSETVEMLHNMFYDFSEDVYAQVSAAYTYTPAPCEDYSSEYFKVQMKLHYVYDKQYFDAMEKFKHAMAAAAYIRQRAPFELRLASLRAISHDILNTMNGQPPDYILMCFGQQFAIAKKLGKTPEARKVKEHAHFMQNIVSKLAIHDFSTYMADEMARYKCYNVAATHAPQRV